MKGLLLKLRASGKKEENRELVINSILALIVRIGGASAAFFMNVAIARYLGASEAGYFFLAIIIVSFVSIISRFGADNVVLRYVSIHSEKNEWEEVRGVVSVISKWIWITSLFITIICCIFSKQISVRIFHKEDLTWPLFWASFSIPFYSVFNILGMALQGRRKVLLSGTILKILSPLFLIISVIFLSVKNSEYASVYYTISCIITLLISYYWWTKNVPKAKGTYDFGKLWKSCFPLWIMAIMQQLVIWGGQFVAGIFNSPSELAQLAVARNTSVLITFILTAVNYVSAPRFAAMYNEGKMEKLKAYVRNTTWLMILIATPIVLVIWFFPGYLMSLFGKDFSSGIWLLRVLAIGQYINVITGSVGYLLMMSGNESDMMKVAIINGIAAVMLAFILNPIYGALGSAIASAIAVAASNLMALGYVQKRLGFNTLQLFGNIKPKKRKIN